MNHSHHSNENGEIMDMKPQKPEFQVRRIERGFWTYDLYLPGLPPLYSVGEVHGDEREARRRAKVALVAEVMESS